VEAEARNLGASVFTRLQQREMIRNFDLVSVNLQFCHRRSVLFPVCLETANKPIFATSSLPSRIFRPADS
jgi:hypothetical protein